MAGCGVFDCWKAGTWAGSPEVATVVGSKGCSHQQSAFEPARTSLRVARDTAGKVLRSRDMAIAPAVIPAESASHDWLTLAAIGTVVTFGSAWLASPLFERDSSERE